jgi:hypothetical protein
VVVVVEVVVVEVDDELEVFVVEVDDELEVDVRLAVDIATDELSTLVDSGILVEVIGSSSIGCVFDRVVISKISLVVSARLFCVIAKKWFENII